MSDAEATEAAEFIAGDGAGAEVNAPMAPAGGKPDPLFDKMLEGIAEAAGVAEEPAAEEPKAEAKDEKKDEEDEEPEFDDLSDDRPWTPERIKNASAQLKSDKRKIGGMLAALEKRGRKFNKKLDEFRTQKQQVDLIERRIMTDVEAVRTGTAEQALAALARLGQRDPHSMYEQISLAMLGKAGQPKTDPIIAELKQQVAELKQELETGRKAQTESQHTAQTRREIRACLGSAEEWPTLAAIAQRDPDQAAAEFEQEYVNQSKAAGRWLDVEAVADRIERRLRKSQPSRQAQNDAAGSGPGREQETRAQANPEQAQSPPRSLSPNLSATSGGARREPSEEERTAEFARNAPAEFFQQFGF